MRSLVVPFNWFKKEDGLEQDEWLWRDADFYGDEKVSLGDIFLSFFV